MESQEVMALEQDEVKSQKKVMEKLFAFVVERVKAGDDKVAISQKLVDMGIDRDSSDQMVESMHAEIIKAAQEEQLSSHSILPAVMGGVAAAVVGGAVWGLIVVATGYVIGFMAWGLGLVTGFAVLRLSGGRRGLPLQVVAVALRVLGIAVAKYWTFYYFLKKAIEKDYGASTAATISVFSEKVLQLFIENIGSMLSGFDLLWLLLAVMTAWRIPKGLGIKLSQWSNSGTPLERINLFDRTKP